MDGAWDNAGKSILWLVSFDDGEQVHFWVSALDPWSALRLVFDGDGVQETVGDEMRDPTTITVRTVEADPSERLIACSEWVA